MTFGRWLIFVLLAVVVAGCQYLIPAAGDRPVGGYECLGVAVSKCTEFLEQARARGPVAAIRIRCTIGSCTEAEGEVEVTVWRPDGRVEQSGAGWMSIIDEPPIGNPPGGPGGQPQDPMPPVPPICLGVPIDWCRQLASQVAEELEVGRVEEIVSITVRCTRVCDATQGEGQTIVVLRDGQRSDLGWGYDGAAP